MKLLKKIKTLFMRNNSGEYEKIIFPNKQCPQCTSRGIFVFRSNSNNKTPIDLSNENKS
jgi:hypothetical protein